MDIIELLTRIFDFVIINKHNTLNLRKVCQSWCTIVDSHFILKTISDSPIKLYLIYRNYFSKVEIKSNSDSYVLWYPRSNELYIKINKGFDMVEIRCLSCLFEYQSLLVPNYFGDFVSVKDFKQSLLKLFKHEAAYKVRLKFGISKLFEHQNDSAEHLGNFYRRMAMYQFLTKPPKKHFHQWFDYSSITLMITGEYVCVQRREIKLNPVLQIKELLYYNFTSTPLTPLTHKKWEIIPWSCPKKFFQFADTGKAILVGGT